MSLHQDIYEWLKDPVVVFIKRTSLSEMVALALWPEYQNGKLFNDFRRTVSQALSLVIKNSYKRPPPFYRIKNKYHIVSTDKRYQNSDDSYLKFRSRLIIWMVELANQKRYTREYMQACIEFDRLTRGQIK